MTIGSLDAQAPLPGRITSLDSLRGIAAFLVVVRHCVHMQESALAWPGGTWLQRAAELIGKEAVLVFFVLSGFVLFLSIHGSTRRFEYLPYVAKRVTRIYLPFVAGILLSALLYHAVGHDRLPGLSGWFNGYNWSNPPSLEIVLGHLAMTDRMAWQTLDAVMWSLVHEMRISLVFPLLAFAIIRDWRWAMLGSLVISIIGLVFYKRFGPVTVNLLSTARYLWMFAAGAVMALHAVRLREVMSRQGPGVRAGLWLVTLVLLAIPVDTVENLTTPVGSILLVFLCFADAPVDRRLSGPLPEWLGRISYSLYLTHLPVLLALTHVLYGMVPMAVLLVIIVVAALLVAELTNRIVEQPAIILGRKLAKAFSAAPRTAGGAGTPHAETTRLEKTRPEATRPAQ